jgi:opacity protein-like surface antigen
MNRVLIAGAFILAVAGQAVAADMPAPFPSPQPPASYYPALTPFNWGGFYVGANGGYGFGTSSWSAAAVTSATAPPSSAIATGPFNLRGLLAGGTLGLNLQASDFVFGAEADGDWTNLKGSSSYCGMPPHSRSGRPLGQLAKPKAPFLARCALASDMRSIGSLSMVRAASPTPRSKRGLARQQLSTPLTISAGPQAPALNSPLPTTGPPRSNTSTPPSVP